MSVVTDPIPPVPTSIDIVEPGHQEKPRLSSAWKHWFLQIREKINAINQSLYDLSTVVGDGIAVKNPDGTWSTASIVPVASGGTGVGSVTAGNYIVGAGTAAFTEKTPTQVRTDIGAAPAMTTTAGSATGGAATALPALPVGYVEIKVGANTKLIPYYDP
jgi:hypothetical protein